MKQRVKQRLRLFSVGLMLAVMIVALPAGAHHSLAMFDITKQQQVSGRIAKLEFENPHTVTRLLALDSKGVVREWVFEGASVSVLFRAGWRRDTLRPGDEVTITFAPLRNAAHGGLFISALLPGGYKLYNVGILPGAPGYKDSNQEEQRRTITALAAARATPATQRN